MRTVLFAVLLTLSTLVYAEDWWERAERQRQENIQRERQTEHAENIRRSNERQREFERRDWEQKEREKDREATREQACLQQRGNWIGGQCFRF